MTLEKEYGLLMVYERHILEKDPAFRMAYTWKPKEKAVLGQGWIGICRACNLHVGGKYGAGVQDDDGTVVHTRCRDLPRDDLRGVERTETPVSIFNMRETVNIVKAAFIASMEKVLKEGNLFPRCSLCNHNFSVHPDELGKEIEFLCTNPGCARRVVLSDLELSKGAWPL